jgi:hypothetical protein
MPTCVSEEELLTVDQNFHPLPLKIGNAILLKVVSLDKPENFHIGRF